MKVYCVNTIKYCMVDDYFYETREAELINFRFSRYNSNVPLFNYCEVTKCFIRSGHLHKLMLSLDCLIMPDIRMRENNNSGQ